MGTCHLREIDAASVDAVTDAERVQHVRWCVPCRNKVTDYCWFQQRLSAAMNALAEEVATPRPDWPGLRRRLRAKRRRQNVARRISGAVGLTLAACLTLLGAPLGIGLWDSNPLGVRALPVPSPVLPVAESGNGRPLVTITPSASLEDTASDPVTVFASLPTPRAALGTAPGRHDGR